MSSLNPENMLKGRIAESLVEEMLKSVGFQVYRFGYETILQNLTQNTKKIENTIVGRKIKSMPDFIIVNKEGKAEFIEVKYRKKPKEKIILKNYWDEARLIIVTPKKPCFRISRIKEYKKRGKLYSLENDKFIKVDKKTIQKFENLVGKYYS